MQTIGHIIVRLVIVTFGLFVAMLAAGIFLSFGLFAGAFTEFFAELQIFLNDVDPNAEEFDASAIVTLLVVVAGFFTSFHVMSLAALPTAIAIAIAELMRWRGMVTNLLLGGVVALSTGLSVYSEINDGLPSDGTLVVLLAIGFIAGFFYWLIAGRTAGIRLGESVPGETR